MSINRTFKFLVIVFTLFVAVGIFQNCSDEFDFFNEELTLNTGWEETTIVFANFNISGKIHLIRVNRGFAAADFFDVNSIQDSIQYAPDELEVYFYKIYNEDTVRTYRCYDTVVQKDEGEYFNTGENIMYAFRETNMLDYPIGDLEYGVEIRTPKNKIIRAKTLPIGGFGFNSPHPALDVFGFSANIFKVEFNVPENSQAYEVIAKVGYEEISLTNGVSSSTPYNFMVNVGRSVAGEPSLGGETLELTTPSSSFYRKLASNIRTYGDTVNTVSRKFSYLSIEAISGNGDLALAISSGSTTTGFSDNMVSYSNVINGLGYVSAYNSIIKVFNVNTATADSVRARFPQFKFQR